MLDLLLPSNTLLIYVVVDVRFDRLNSMIALEKSSLASNLTIERIDDREGCGRISEGVVSLRVPVGCQDTGIDVEPYSSSNGMNRPNLKAANIVSDEDLAQSFAGLLYMLVKSFNADVLTIPRLKAVVFVAPDERFTLNALDLPTTMHRVFHL